MSGLKTNSKRGFTIIELLIVIVVIAILATISIVAYNGIQGRAHDVAIKNDFRNLAKKFELYRVDNGVYPAGHAQLRQMDLRVSKSAYGNGMIDNTYNLLYCRVVADGPDKFALIAGSKSGKLFAYTSESGAIETLAAWNTGGSTGNCQAVGINQTHGSDRDFFYISSSWQSYAG